MSVALSPTSVRSDSVTMRLDATAIHCKTDHLLAGEEKALLYLSRSQEPVLMLQCDGGDRTLVIRSRVHAFVKEQVQAMAYSRLPEQSRKALTVLWYVLYANENADHKSAGDPNCVEQRTGKAHHY